MDDYYIAIIVVIALFTIIGIAIYLWYPSDEPEIPKTSDSDSDNSEDLIGQYKFKAYNDETKCLTRPDKSQGTGDWHGLNNRDLYKVTLEDCKQESDDGYVNQLWNSNIPPQQCSDDASHPLTIHSYQNDYMNESVKGCPDGSAAMNSAGCLGAATPNALDSKSIIIPCRYDVYEGNTLLNNIQYNNNQLKSGNTLGLCLMSDSDKLEGNRPTFKECNNSNPQWKTEAV